MPFSNPIVGGTVLIRPAIKSPDYLTGVSGWSINKDGSAEFNDVVIRGGTTTQGVILMYNGAPAAGNLIASVAASAGTDEFGNAYKAGITTYDPGGSGLYTQLQSDGDLALGYDTVFDNPGLLSALFNGMHLVSPYNDASPNDDPITLSLLPGSTTGADRGFSQLFTGNGLDVDFRVIGATTINTQETATVPLTVDAVAGTTANLVEAGVDGTTLFQVDDNGSMTSANTEWGTVQTAAPGAGGGTTTASVNFAKTFPNTPRVLVTIASASDPGATTIRVYVDNESTTGFDVSCYRSTNAATNIRWFAISD